MRPAIPPLILDGLRRYAETGTPVGSFLEAVIANDLQMAVGRADHNSLAALHSIVSYVYNEFPSTCHGSYKVYRGWIAFHDAKRAGAKMDALKAATVALYEAKNEANAWRR